MKYVGIKNSDIKSHLVKVAKKNNKKIKVPVPGIGYSCFAHFELLRLFDENAVEKEFCKTEYYHFASSTGKSHDTIMKKIKKFRKLYRSIRENGYHNKYGYIIVTSDGARLDGSHRAAIVEHLGIEVKAIVVDPEKHLSDKEYIEYNSHLEAQQLSFRIKEKAI